MVSRDALGGRRLPVLIILAGVLALGAPARSTTGDGIPIAGRVLDDAGRPLAGVSVTLSVEPDEFTAVGIVLAGHVRPESVAETATDDGGWFTLWAPEVGLWRVTVEARGRVPMRTSLLPLTDAVVVPPVALAADVGIEVTVVAPGGGPVAGAQVWGVGEDRARWLAASRDGWRTTGRFALTGAEGRAHLPRATGEPFRLYAFAPGFVEAAPPVASEAARATVRLRAGTAFDVRFENPQGRPLEGAVVRVGSGASPLGYLGADGIAHFVAVPGERLDFEVATAEGQVESGSFEVAADDEPVEARTMRLPEPVVVSGRVVEAETRAAVAGALVWNQREPRHAVRSDPRGGYRMVLRETSAVRLEGAALGYDQAMTEVRPSGPGSVEAPTLVLAPAVTIGGRVLDPGGQPVAGARVMATAEHVPSRAGSQLTGARQRRTVSLPDGGFYFTAVPPGHSWQLVAEMDGFAPVRAAIGEGGWTILVLGPPRRAFGVVVDEDERPLADAEVTILPRRGGEDPMRAIVRRDALDAAPPPATTDAEGRFRFDGLAAGDYALVTQRAGHALRIDRRVEVEADVAATDLGAIRLAAAAPIAGVVVDSADRPIAGAEVSVLAAAIMRLGNEVPQLAELLRDHRRVAADIEGRFRIETLASGEQAHVGARAEGFADGEHQVVVAPARRVRIVLARGGSLAGSIVDRSGQPVAGAWVMAMVKRDGGFSSRTSSGTDAEGRFEILGVTAGVALLEAHAEGHPSGRLEGIEVRAGERREGLRIVLEAAATLAGTVTDEDGVPVVGASIFVMPADQMLAVGSTNAESDGDGRFRIFVGEPGSYRLHVGHDRYPQLERSVEIEAGEQRLDLVLRSGGALRGIVLDDRGEPLAGADVRLDGTIDGRYAPHSARTDDSGSFALEGLDDGTYRVHASLDGWAPATSPAVTVGGLEQAFVELRLARGATIVGRVSGLEAAEHARLQVEATHTVSSDGRVAAIAAGGERFRIDNASPGWWTVRGQVGSTARYAVARVEVLEGAGEAAVELEFGGGLVLSGTVTARGEPVAGAYLSAGGAVGSAQTVTDAAGRYRFEGLEPGAIFVTLSEPRSGLMVQRQLELDGDRELDLEIETAEIRGRTVDAAGQPVAGAQIRLDPAPGASRLRVPRFATSGATGHFTVVVGDQGSFLLHATHADFAVLRRSLEVTPGAPLDLELVLESADRVRLAVQRADGGSVDEITVTVLDAQGISIVQTSAPVIQGFAEIGSVPLGSWRFAVSARGTAWTEVTASLPGDVPPVVLLPGAMVELRVPDLMGQLTPAQLSIRDPQGNDLLPSVFRQPGTGGFEMWAGRTSLTGLAPGPWIIEVATDDGRRWQTVAQGVAGQLTEVVVE